MNPYDYYENSQYEKLSESFIDSNNLDSNQDYIKSDYTAKKNKKGFNKKLLNIASSIGNSIPSVKNSKFQGENQDNIDGNLNSGKDAIGQAIPVAGIFRGVEKLGTNIGGKVDGDRGKSVSQGFFDPAGTGMKLFSDEDVSTEDAIIGTLLAGYGGKVLNDKNQARKKKFEEEKFRKIRTKREEDFYNKKKESSLENLTKIRQNQLNYLSENTY